MVENLVEVEALENCLAVLIDQRSLDASECLSSFGPDFLDAKARRDGVAE
jgi:hypothetical protein